MLELSIDWPGLFSAFQMNMPELKCFFCLDDGRVLKISPGDPNLEAIRKDKTRYARIEIVSSRIQYQWISEFAATLKENDTRAIIEAAINGKGAFRRFKDILLTMPEERKQWFDFRDQKMRLRICEWVRECNIIPLNPPPWSEQGLAVQTDRDFISDLMTEVLGTWNDESQTDSRLKPEEIHKLTLELYKKLEPHLK